jgi:pyruvate dehydrogenase E2 component (dihydrolipoamide acetyltransferase)
MIEFKLPSLGAEMDEGTLLEWKVKPGDAVRKGDVVAVVDTSKSAIDVEIWQEGTVLELAHAVHDKVPVGTVIARLLEPGETREHAEEEKRRFARDAARAAPPTAVRAAAAQAPVPVAAAPSAGVERRRISPAARMRAEALGIDLGRVAGTGPQGAVTLEDIEHAAKAAPAAPASPATPAERALAMRTAIGAVMARAKREIPHYYLATAVPLDRATRWLAARNAGRPITERVLMAALLVKAVALALRRYPEFNGHYRDGTFVPGAGIHVGVAISLRQGGLIAPALRDTDTLSLDVLMQRLTDLVARARALTLRSSEMTDATVTVTNLGEQGVDVVQPVIYAPQVAIVGFGRPSDRPWVQEGRMVAVPVVTASLAADHRVSDGHRGALFLNELGERLQQPERLDEGNP